MTVSVCFVTEDFYPQFIGGQGMYGKELVEGLVKKKVNITVLAEKRSGRSEFWINKKISLFLVPFCFGNQLVLGLFEYIYFIFHLRKKTFDILHANQLSGMFFLFSRPGNIKKIIVSVHNTYWDMYQHEASFLKRLLYRMLMIIEQYVYEHADGIITNSQLEYLALKRKYHVDSIPYAVVPLGSAFVHFSSREREKAREKMAKKFGKKKFVLSVGRLVKRKRVDILVTALKILEKERTDVAGVIIGRGKEYTKLKKLAGGDTHFLGFVEDTKPYFLGTDMFVNLSVGEGGVVLTALEAARFGLPLLLSKDSGEYPLEEGKNGYNLATSNPNEIANKIKTILKHAKKMGGKSRVLVKNFSWEKCQQKTYDFYLTLQKV